MSHMFKNLKYSVLGITLIAIIIITHTHDRYYWKTLSANTGLDTKVTKVHKGFISKHKPTLKGAQRQSVPRTEENETVACSIQSAPSKKRKSITLSSSYSVQRKKPHDKRQGSCLNSAGRNRQERSCKGWERSFIRSKDSIMNRKSNVPCAENILICGTSRRTFAWIGA